MEEEVDEQVSECSSVSKAYEDRVLNKEIGRENNKTVGSDGLVGSLSSMVGQV